MKPDHNPYAKLDSLLAEASGFADFAATNASGGPTASLLRRLVGSLRETHNERVRALRCTEKLIPLALVGTAQYVSAEVIEARHLLQGGGTYPVPPVTKRDVHSICFAYEHGVGQALRNLKNPYPEGSAEREAWDEGVYAGKEQEARKAATRPEPSA